MVIKRIAGSLRSLVSKELSIFTSLLVSKERASKVKKSVFRGSLVPVSTSRALIRRASNIAKRYSNSVLVNR
jgi:hypothetical protein